MYSISVINPKGGCGKSTIAMNIAGLCALQGAKTALLDMDVQGSAKAWLSLRPADRPPIHSASLSAGKLVVSPRPEYLIIDTPAGMRESGIAKLAQMSNALVIPLLPSPIDMIAAGRFIQTLLQVPQVQSGKVRVGTLATRVREDTLAAMKLEVFLKGLRLPSGSLIPLLSVLRASRNYIEAVERGLSIFELAPSRCYYDWEQWMPVKNWLLARD